MKGELYQCNYQKMQRTTQGRVFNREGQAERDENNTAKWRRNFLKNYQEIKKE